MRRRTFLAGSLAGLATATLASAAAKAAGAAGSYPSRPVRLVVAYPAGMGTDVFARRFADFMQKTLGQPFVVENRPGAGGNIGTASVARAEPDGYTLLWGTNATSAMNEYLYSHLGYDPVKDFEPVARVVSFGMVLYVKQASPLRSLGDLLAKAKAKDSQGKDAQMDVAVPSTTARAVLQMVSAASGAQFYPVPYSGSGQALANVLGGQIPVALDTVTASLGGINSGQIRPLAISLGQRSASLPDVPTFREAGVNVEAEAWNACYAPRGTPAAIVELLNKTINAGLQDPTLRAAIIKDGAEPTGGTPRQLADLVDIDRAKWGPAIKSLNLSMQ